MLGCIHETRILCCYPDIFYYTSCIAAFSACLWYESVGSYVRSSKKLPAAQGFCAEKWPAADRYNHLWLLTR